MPYRNHTSERPASSRSRPLARLAGWAFAAATLGLSALPAQAQVAFSPAQSLVFVAENTPSDLKEATQSSGALTFSTLGTATGLYNAIGFRTSDMLIYGILDSSTDLVQIDANGAMVDMGPSGIPASALSTVNNGGTVITTNLVAGTFGDASGSTDYSNVLFVKNASVASTSSQSTSSQIWAVTVDSTGHAAGVQTITTSVPLPNVADMVFTQGYLWAVNGLTATVYRIDPVSGAVVTGTLPTTTTTTAPSTSGIYEQAYGAQWMYGNGNIGISGNNALVGGTQSFAYQIQINNATSAAPTFTIVAAQLAPFSGNNDGASYVGPPVNLSLSKTATVPDGSGNFHYQFTVTNQSAAGITSSGSFITDPLVGVTVDTTTLPPGCSVATSGGGTVMTCSVESLAGQTSATFTVNATLNSGVTTATNTATLTGNEADTDPDDNTSTVVSSTEKPVLGITKTSSNTGALVTGTDVTYTVTVTNTGAVPATNAVITDPLPITGGVASFSWDRTCSTVSASCTDATAQLGPINDTLTIPADGTVTYTITATPDATVPAVVTNTANVTLPNPSDGVCADSSTPPCSASVSNPAQATMAITKTANKATATANGQVTYTINVANTGVVDATNVTVKDPLLTLGGATLTGVTYSWTCVVTGGATCAAGNQTGAVNDGPNIFPAHSTATYTVVAKLPATAAAGSQLDNTATVTFTPSPGAAPVPPLPATKSINVVRASLGGVGSGIFSIPTLDARALALLAVLLCGMGWLGLRKTRR